MAHQILIAPSAFKGSLGPRAVAQALAAGVSRVLPDAQILACPVSDGGDGLLDAMLGPGSFREPIEVAGPLGEQVRAELGWRDAETAVVESAAACGLALLAPEHRDPMRATTRGVGELIRAAVERGARTVVVGLGGTATVDGGTGMARALGWTFRDKDGQPLAEGGGSLVQLADVGAGWPLEVEVVGLTDVRNPLLGEEGAATVYGPQKGADAPQVAELERGLTRLAEWAAAHGHPDVPALPGAGAAGGLGAGLVLFARGTLRAGAEWVLDQIGFDAALARADLVIAGEGVFDRTSWYGKAAGEVVRRAQTARRMAALVAGRVEAPLDVPHAAGEGRWLTAEDLADLAAKVTAQAFGLPGAQPHG